MYMYRVWQFREWLYTLACKRHFIDPRVCDVTVQVIDEDGCQSLSHDVGTYFLHELAKMRDEFEVIGDVRGKGLMIGLELVTDKVRDYFSETNSFIG